jgi:hypothetical protein
MIPYDELVAALANWRQRQGLPAGPADYLGEPAQTSYDYAPPAAPAASGGYGGGFGGEDVVELSDEMMDSVVEEQSSPYTVEAEETDYAAAQGEIDSQDQDIDAYLDAAIPGEPTRAEPDPEPEPARSGGRRKRKR